MGSGSQGQTGLDVESRLPYERLCRPIERSYVTHAVNDGTGRRDAGTDSALCNAATGDAAMAAATAAAAAAAADSAAATTAIKPSHMHTNR
jgi:hypothetical protein